MIRTIITLVLLATLCFASLGFDTCGKKGNSGDDKKPVITKDQALVYARDIASGLRSALPLITRLDATVGKWFAEGIPIADEVIEAVANSDVTKFKDLLTALVPIITRTVARFSTSIDVLTYLALADIGIHFLINHADEIFGTAAVEIARSAANGPPTPLTKYARQEVWGCKYQPAKCKP